MRQGAYSHQVKEVSIPQRLHLMLRAFIEVHIPNKGLDRCDGILLVPHKQGDERGGNNFGVDG